MPFINRKKKVKQQQTPYKHYNDEGRQYYNTSLWHNLRNYYIKQHPLCEECLKDGMVKEAEDVHHTIPFLQGKTDEERWQLLLNEDNLESLCTIHHKDIHNRMKRIKNNK